MTDKSVAAKKTAFQMRVEPGWFDPIDKWRGVQKPILSRTKAVKFLVAAGLSKQSRPSKGTP